MPAQHMHRSRGPKAPGKLRTKGKLCMAGESLEPRGAREHRSMRVHTQYWIQALSLIPQCKVMDDCASNTQETEAGGC